MNVPAHDAASAPRALTLGRAIASGELDPMQLAEDALARAERLAGAFITLCTERALVEARAAKARRDAGLPRGPLDGVPIAWKDLFDVQGTVTTAGSVVLRDRPPVRRDAPVVARAAGAGLVAIGKTNLSEFAYSGLGLNPHYGTPANPASPDVARVPGGSSSGSAVAVAAGVVPLAVGSDTAGSLRVPAAFNGIVSYRPSRARHDQTGVFPLAATLDTIGPMATSVADCLALDDAMRTGVVQPRRAAPPEMLRLVVDQGVLEDGRVAPAVRANLERAVARLEGEGVQVVRRPLVAVAETLRLVEELGWLGAAEAHALHAPLLRSKDADRLDPRVRQRLLVAGNARPENVVTLQRARERLIAEVRDELEGTLLVMPTVAHAAPELAPLVEDADEFARVNFETLRLTMVGSYLDLPTVALPSGTDDEGQHTGLQVSAPMGEDERLLRAALTLSRLLGIESPAPEDDMLSKETR